MKITPVILSGGMGTRLWPLSRKEYPKQYLPLCGSKTMLQETILRLNGLDNLTDPIIICNVEHRFLVAEQCREIDITSPTILLEPIGRNTAPAITAASLQSLKHSKEALLLVLSADHVINDVDSFQVAINIASKQALNGSLVTFGIVPTDANTSYGYINKGEPINDVFKVKEFVEKPNQKTADLFFKSGDYLWNSGMFIFKTRTLIEELKTHSPDVIKSVAQSVNGSKQDLDFIRLEEYAFASSPNVSIDYAIMEKSRHVAVVPLDVGWSDIGSWKALYDLGTKDSDGNVVNGDVIAKDTTNTYINSGNRLVATIGIDNLIVVDTIDVTFIATKDTAQDVNTIVELLRCDNRDEALSNSKVYRPWGWYEPIGKGTHYQVKKLYVKSGAKLSLQLHHKRAEHWVVVSGVATVINGEDIFSLTEGGSTYIPIGVRHSIENKTNKKLEIIEVQSGTYLHEDDIVRFEDIYGRVKT